MSDLFARDNFFSFEFPVSKDRVCIIFVLNGEPALKAKRL